MRQSAGSSPRLAQRTYKEKDGSQTKHSLKCSRQFDSILFKSIFALVGIIVMAMFIVKFFIAFAPLTSICARHIQASALPSLLDATAEDLMTGLNLEAFTSVDLVEVNIIF